MTGFSPGQRIGLAIGMLVGLESCVDGLLMAGGTDPTAIPIVALFVGLGAFIVGLLGFAWCRKARWPIRAAAVLIILNALGAVPAFAVADVPVGARLSAGFAILGGLAAVVLLYTGRRSQPSTEERSP
jgi:peptidoglycan/LPS O-acetylase OafA/YrhL